MVSSTFSKPASAGTPIFMENPDGTITEAIPSNCKDKSAKVKHPLMPNPEDSDASTGNLSEGTRAQAGMRLEVDFLYERHEQVMFIMIAMQFALELLYDIVYVKRMRDGNSVKEFADGRAIDEKGAANLFWTIFVLQVGFSTSYYIIAGMALLSKLPKGYQALADFSIVGIVFVVLLTSIGKFNVIVFFMHVLIYFYARYLQGLTASMLLLPPSAVAQAP